jgi:type II secretory pathway component PulF
MKDSDRRIFTWRLVGFFTISILYGLLALGFILVAPNFHELFKGFGLELNWFAQILIEKPWLCTVPAVIVLTVQLTFLIGVTMGSWPPITYTRVAKISIGFFVLLFLASAFVFYGNIFKLGAMV